MNSVLSLQLHLDLSSPTGFLLREDYFNCICSFMINFVMSRHAPMNPVIVAASGTLHIVAQNGNLILSSQFVNYHVFYFCLLLFRELSCFRISFSISRYCMYSSLVIVSGSTFRGRLAPLLFLPDLSSQRPVSLYCLVHFCNLVLPIQYFRITSLYTS